MGREFASAAARWCHLLDLPFRPVIVAASDPDAGALDWFQRNVPTLEACSPDRETVLDHKLEAIYVAVPHHLHLPVYLDVIRSGKHLMAEKPMGINREAAKAILMAAQARPELHFRVSSEFPFFPGAQRIVKLASEGAFGKVLEVRAKFLHSSDLDPTKPMSWKRMTASNGEYGCMSDLGLHVLHLPLRFGWSPRNVRALLTKVFDRRPDSAGNLVPTQTWDNGVLACEADGFPLLLEMKRIAPGEMNTWSLEIDGTELSARFSTKQPNTLLTLPFEPGRPQAWRAEDLGYASVYPAITGGIFEFGFSDAILQMWAAYCDELVNGPSMIGTFPCARPEEAAQTHALFEAALESQLGCKLAEVR